MPGSLHCPLLDLPNELLILIADKLALTPGSLRQLHSLLLTNRRFSLICTPLLIQRAVSFRDENLERKLEGTVLHWAASKGYADLVERLLAAGIDADIPCRRSMDRPLERAAKCGHANIMQLLISSGASVRRYRYGARSPMVLAARNGHISAIDVLVANGAYYNSRKDKNRPWKEGNAWGEWREGTMALHAAACNGHLDIVKKLLGYGASANAKDNDGVTALVKAAEHGSYDVVCFLASAGVSISDTDRNGKTALHLAIRDHQTTELLCQPSVINVRDEDGCTALHYACQLALPRSVKALLSSGANTEATTKGWTPLIFALSEEFGNLQPRDEPNLVQVIEILLEHGANVNAAAGGLTALHHAALNGHVTIMQKLISSGASVRAIKPGHSPPILHAAENGHVAAIDILVANGAYFNAREEDKGWKEGDAWGEWRDGNKALHAAARGRHLDAFRKLLSHGASTSAKDSEGIVVLLKSAQYAAYDIISFLLSLGVSISDVDHNGNTALHLAVDAGMEMKLLCHPSIIDARNGDGLTALHLACREQYVDYIKMLLDCGADIEAKNNEEQTPLIFTFADEYKYEYEYEIDSDLDDDDPYYIPVYKDPYGDLKDGLCQVLTTLLAGGANIDAVDNIGWSALNHAVRWSHDKELEASRILIEHGANPDGGRSGTTPLHIAQKLGREDVVKNLLEKGANRDLLDWQGRTYLDTA